MIRHNGPISGVACSKNFVATAGYDNQVILWNQKSKTALARGFHDHLANRCEISSDEKYLLSASSDYTARLWELPEMRLKTVFNGHTDDVEMARFSPCGKMIATTCYDGLVRIFDIDGSLRYEFSGHAGTSSSCVWSKNGDRLVSSGDDGTVRIWNLTSGKEEKVIRPENVQTDTVTMSCGGTIYSGNDAGELIRIAGDEILSLKVHKAGIKNLCINSDESLLATMSYDRDLALVRIKNGLTVIRRIQIPEQVWVRSCTFKDGNHLIFGTFGSSYAVLNLATGNWDFSNVHDTDCINAVYVDDQYVFTVGDSGEIRRANLDSKKSVFRARHGIARVGSLCNFITKYRDLLICGGHLGKVFDAHSGTELLDVRTPINKALQVGEYLVLATYVGELAIARIAQDSRLTLIGRFKVLQNAVKDICAEGNLVFCGGAAADIALFDLQQMRLIATHERAHDNIVNSCAALGWQRFVTVSRDLRMNIWRGLKLEGTYKTPHNHSVKCVAVCDEGRFIASGSYDGKLAIFDRPNREWISVQKLTAAGISSVTFAAESFWASAYDGQVFRVTP